MEKVDIKSLDFEELKDFLGSINEKPFRAIQIYEWLHKQKAVRFEDMSNLSKETRAKLETMCTKLSFEIIDKQESKLDQTKKYLFELEDKNAVESIWMQYKHGNSVCISSQVGCKMGCTFCASTIGGLTRNLTPAEMLEQIYAIERDTNERVSNVVVMGTGEPLDNYENLIKFIKLLTNDKGLNISQRNITVSTCGLVPKIEQLANENLQITLAISLHATTDETRKKLMPIANRYSIDQILEACEYYYYKTNRRISYEYSLVANVNDSVKEAIALAKLLQKQACHVNLIPINPIKERAYIQPSMERVIAFKNKLEKYGINVTIRREMGRDIDGACGQLRRRHIGNKVEEVTLC